MCCNNNCSQAEFSPRFVYLVRCICVPIFLILVLSLLVSCKSFVEVAANIIYDSQPCTRPRWGAYEIDQCPVDGYKLDGGGDALIGSGCDNCGWGK